MKPKASRSAWKREASDQHVTSKLGQRIRERREKLGLSLANVSEISGIPAATLSRIETNKMSPTFSLLLKLMTGLRLPWADLMKDSSDISDYKAESDPQISIALPDSDTPTTVPGYSYLAPHHKNPVSEHIQPLIFDVLARNLEEAGGLRGHSGYEFCYILQGPLIFYAEGREPCELPTGASLLFQCEIPHAYVSRARKPARILNVTFMDPVFPGLATPFAIRYPAEEGE